MKQGSLEAVKLEGKGIDRKLGSLEAVKLEGKRIGDAGGQRLWNLEVGMRPSTSSGGPKSEKGIGKAEFEDRNAINFNQSHP